MNVTFYMELLDAFYDLNCKLTDSLKGEEARVIKVKLEQVQPQIVLHYKITVVAFLDVNNPWKSRDVL